jgi:hypothetical protein
MRKLMCHLGLHQLYLDAAMFSSVRRCNFCDYAEGHESLRRLERERELWNEPGATRESVVQKLYQERIKNI